MMSFVYLVFMFMGTIISLTSSSWFLVWLGLEMNMMGFIPFVGVKNQVISEAVFKYFLIQVVGSLMLFIIGLIGSLGWGYWFFVYDTFLGGGVIVFISALKLGASPFHYWFLAVSENLDWVSLFMLMTWQKFAPLGLIVVSGWSVVSVFIIGVSSVIIGGFGGFNQLLMKRLMAYSSVSHLGWMVVLIIFSWGVGLFYYFMYILVSLSVVLYFWGSGYEHVGQMSYNVWLNYLVFGGFCLSLFSLGGLPPFLGFCPSWVGLILMLEEGYFWLGFGFVLLGLTTLYFYLRLGYSLMLGSLSGGVWGFGGSVGVLSGVFGVLTLVFMPVIIFFI
nr:NADH dehydrogenase subunit 2 [Nedyopus patrioticus unicolor]